MTEKIVVYFGAAIKEKFINHKSIQWKSPKKAINEIKNHLQFKNNKIVKTFVL